MNEDRFEFDLNDVKVKILSRLPTDLLHESINRLNLAINVALFAMLYD